jgi:hypothetical protein
MTKTEKINEVNLIRGYNSFFGNLNNWNLFGAWNLGFGIS